MPSERIARWPPISDVICKGVLNATKVIKTGDQQSRCDKNAEGDRLRWKCSHAKQGPAKAIHSAHHGIQLVQDAPALRNYAGWVCDGCGQKPELHKKADNVV